MPQKTSDPQRFDAKELELPETLFVRDIDNRVFQHLVAQALARVPDVALIGGGFMHNILGRGNTESVSAIHAEQDSQAKSLKIRVDLNIAYGVPIPDKAEEIQNLLNQELTRLTGLHVASIHLVFRGLLTQENQRHGNESNKQSDSQEGYKEGYKDGNK